MIYYRKNNRQKGCTCYAQYKTNLWSEKLYRSFEGGGGRLSGIPDQNGRGEYVILDMKEYDKMRATIALLSKLEEGEQSARKGGWISADEVEKALGI